MNSGEQHQPISRSPRDASTTNHIIQPESDIPTKTSLLIGRLRKERQNNQASKCPSWFTQVRINDVLLLALMDTGCNTMVFQSKYAARENLPTKPLNQSYQVSTAAEGHKITVDKLTTQTVELFDANSETYIPIGEFNFEIAPIGIPCILGLPLLQKLGIFQVNMLVSPNEIIPLSGPTEMRIQLDRALPIKKLKPTDRIYYHRTDFSEKDKIRARSYDHKYREPKIKRPKQKPIDILSSVSNKRFNREMKRKAYIEAYGIHFNKVDPDHDLNFSSISMLTKDIPDWLRDVGFL